MSRDTETMPKIHNEEQHPMEFNRPFRRNTPSSSARPILAALAAILVAARVAHVAPPAAPADTFDPEKAVPVEVLLSHEALLPGEPARLAAVFHVPKNYHITDIKYEMFFVEADTLQHVRLDNLRYPPGVKEHGEKVYRGDVTVFGDVTVSPGAQLGTIDWTVYAGYQICSEVGDLTCYMPVEKTVELKLSITDEADLARTANAEVFGGGIDGGGAELSLEDRLQSALQRGSWLAFVLVFVGGVLSSLTPCVYPVIPITISFIGARSKGKLHGFIQSLFFVLGMALVYSSLGVVAALSGKSFGSFGASPVMNAAVAAIFLTLAAGMFGAYEMQMPSSVSAKLQSGDRSGPLGAILMGAVTGFIAAPCVGPIIAGLLIFIASTQSIFTGFFLMLTYALGMGLLFLVIGTFAGALSTLPGADSWMETVKKFFGVVMVAMALYFLRFLIPEAAMPYLSGAGLVIFGVYTGAFHPLSEESGGAEKFYKALGLVAVVLGAKFLIWGWGAPGAGIAGLAGTAERAELEWEISSPQSDRHVSLLEEARSEGRPAVVDFWAEWCVQCRELDHKTWVDPEIYAEGQRFARIKMDMTDSESVWAQTQNERFQVVGMPTVIFYDSDGEETKRFVGFKKPHRVLEYMQAVR